MKVQLLVSSRFLKPRDRKSNFSLMAFISILGIVLGVMIPIIVLSVLIGFQEEIKSKILGVKGHLVLTTGDNQYIRNYKELIHELKQENPEIVSAVPYIEVQGMAQFYNSYEPIIVRGVNQDIFQEDKEFSHLFRIKEGKKSLLKNYQALLGSKLANNNFVSVKDRLKLFIIEEDTLSPHLKPTLLNVRIEGTFETGFQDFDVGVIYVSLKTLQKRFNRSNQIKSIDIKLKNIWQANQLKAKLVSKYGKKLSIFTWQEINFNFFKALSLEKVLMYLIVSLILLVAIFNVMSSQLILIIERKREIGILKTIGMKTSHLIQIFLIQGFIISFIGSFIGGTLGYLVSLDVKLFIGFLEKFINFFLWIIYIIKDLFLANPITFIPFEIFPKGVYYLYEIPSDTSISRVVFFIIMAIVLSLLFSLVPSLKAARLKPIEVMRYE